MSAYASASSICGVAAQVAELKGDAIRTRDLIHLSLGTSSI
jgi:hypothetical protein